MVGSLPDRVLDELPASMPLDTREEIFRFVGALPEGVSCIATGSLVEGLGNAHSDIDLYVVDGAPDARARPTGIGLRKDRYVDCEYFTEDLIGRLVARFSDPASSVADFSARDFDQYYRLAIGVGLVVTPELAGILTRCSTQTHNAWYARWCHAQSFVYLGRAAVARGMGAEREARALLREAAIRRSMSVLADAGEGYPSPKWTESKAARRFGYGTPEYRSCLAGYLDAVGDLSAELARMRELVPVNDTVERTFLRHSWRASDGVELVADKDLLYLVKGVRSLARVDGAAARMIARLYERQPWSTVREDVADELDVTHEELQVAVLADVSRLSDAGFLTTVKGGD